METTRHSTRDLNEAGALWAQDKFKVFFVKLEPVPGKDGLFKFVFDCECTPRDLEEFLIRYTNEQELIEPKKYDQRLSALRDSLRRVRVM